jgi:Cu/Ag efflux protein CusF
MIKLRGKNIGLALLLLCAVFSFSGCPKEKPKSNETPANSKVKLFNGKGIVTKINLELGSVGLDHEAIEGSMPAMVMEFYVKEKSELNALKVGDKVEFVLEENFGQEKIISIKKIQ